MNAVLFAFSVYCNFFFFVFAFIIMEKYVRQVSEGRNDTDLMAGVPRFGVYEP